MKSTLMAARTLVAGVLAGVFLAAATAVEGEISPREPSDAYLTLVRGDEAREAGNRQAAMAAYEDAMVRYQRIAQAHPDWESDIVQFRILYCRNQIETIQRQLGMPEEDDEPDLDSEEPPEEEPGEEWHDVLPEAEEEEEAEEHLMIPDFEAGVVEAMEPDEETGTLYRDRYLAMLQENEYLRRRMAGMGDESDGSEEEEWRAQQDSLREALEAALRREQEADERIRELEHRAQELQKELVTRAARSEAVAEAPYRLDAHYQQWMRDALTRENARDFKGAISLYGRVVEKYPTDIPALKGQARCLLSAGDSNKAIQFLTKREAAIQDPELKILLGTAYGAAGRFRDSAGVVESLVRDNPWNARARAVWGAALLGMGRNEEARAELEKTLDLDDGIVEAWYNLALILSESGPEERGKGREFYQRSLDLGGAPDAALEQRLARP